MTLLDFFEYATDGAAQTAYVSNDATPIKQEYYNTDDDDYQNIGGIKYKGQTFTPASNYTIGSVKLKLFKAGSPGIVTVGIRATSDGIPIGGDLCNGTTDGDTLTSDTGGEWREIIFSNVIALSSGVMYAIVISCAGVYTSLCVRCDGTSPSYLGGTFIYCDDGSSWLSSSSTDLMFECWSANNLQSYSEASIKTQGSYSLKGLAIITNSLNDTLTRTISNPINLSGQNFILFDIYASRIGANIKISIHDSGGTTTEKTYTIISANTWETVSWDISAISDVNKDAIDSIIITIVNADAENTFYLDKMYATTSLIKSVNGISIELIKDINLL